MKITRMMLASLSLAATLAFSSYSIATPADDAAASLREARIVPARTALTVADGLRTSLGQLTFPIVR